MKQNYRKQGSFFEVLVKLIHESYKDKNNTHIYQGHKLVDLSGNKREFDIVIESKANNYPILIVIECKDFKNPISVEKVEAFITKCNSVPSINKKIFVSKNGYQKGAIDSAKRAGIELYQLKDIDSTIVQDWIESLGLKKINTYFYVTNASLGFLNNNNPTIDNSTILRHDVLNQQIKTSEFVMRVFEFHRANLGSMAAEYYNNPTNKIPMGSTLGFYAQFDMKESGLYTKIDNDKIYLAVVELELSYKTQIETLKADTIKEFVQHSNNEKKVDLVSFTSVFPDMRFTVIKDPTKEKYTQIMVTANDGSPLNSLPSFIIPPELKVTIEENNKSSDNG